MRPDADTAWFTIILNGRADFGVYGFYGREAVSEPYRITAELVSLYPAVDVNGMLGAPACLSITDRTGVSRPLHGLVREMSQLHSGNLFTHFECVLVPRFDFLKDTCDHRIFQKKSVVEIITQILEGQGFSGESFSFKCKGSFAPREYCVQYGESDFHFINRLCEEEGIYYYFEHSADGHCLCFSNMAGGPPIAGERVLRFFPGSGQNADTAVIARLNLHGKTVSDTAGYREWNFELPRLDLSVGESAADERAAPTTGGMNVETYRYQHLYQLRDPGKRYADIQLQRQLCTALSISGESDVGRFIPGYSFQVTQHYRSDVNAKWWMLSVEHHGEQPGVLGHEAPDDRSLRYVARFTALPAMTRYVPPDLHRKPLISGRQTAVVTGPEGEEIYADKYGRVKVQFFWDRSDQWNEKTTCWIRVSQGWAGGLYGMEILPRIGHEVIVGFLGGDPDRPIITGRVYAALNMPPYELPTNKTRTVFKSMSTPGEENEARGFHELRVEDKMGEEEIYIHAEKDVNVHIKNDRKDHILHDRHLTVDNFCYTRIAADGEDGGGECHIKVEGARKAELRDEDHLTVHGDKHTHCKISWMVKAGGEIHLESLMKAVIEAGSDLTLKVGPSFVHLSGGKVEIVGPMVSINSGGSPGEGTPAVPLLPIPSELAGNYAEYFILKDKGKVQSDVPYRTIIDGGEEIAGQTDKNGRTHLLIDQNEKTVTIIFEDALPVEIA
jgi:type VI secretion system secreted protein VgrG